MSDGLQATGFGLLLVGALLSGATLAFAQQPPDQPAVTVRGQTYTPRSILSRNMGTDEDQTTAFPPHKIAGNVYYVGTRTLSSFLVTTPAGHILINSTYERNVRTIEKSVTQLGFKFSDIKILLGTHAHGDHQEGDALVKELTGAQVMAMARGCPGPRGDQTQWQGPSDRSDAARWRSDHTGRDNARRPSDRRSHTWVHDLDDDRRRRAGRMLNVVFACSYRSPATVTPDIESELNRTFKVIRSLPCDVPLGDHPAQYNMAAKYARVKPGAPNPFIDPANCWVEAEIQEAMLRAQLKLQQGAKP